jgi:hypothetical protein
MNYSRSIDIPGWEQISEKYKDWIEYSHQGLNSKYIEKTDYEFLESIICPAINTGLRHSIAFGIMFFVRPNVSRGLHVDYNNKEVWDTTQNWALNIPIVNCDNSQMEWYDGDYTEETITRPNGIISNKLTWNSDPVLVESCVINKPTLVHVDMPHDVKNFGTDHRVLLSLRINPNIS